MRLKINKSNNSEEFSGGTPIPEDPEEDDEEKRFNVKNTINIVPSKYMTKSYILDIKNMKSKPVIIYDNLLKDKDLILKIYRNITGIYLLHNSINGKQYVGSAYNLSKRLAYYYFPSRLIDKRYISNSILKYGHENFSLAILEILDNTNIINKDDIIKREQYYIDLYKPGLNINLNAYSSLGYKHSEKTKKLLSKLGKNRSLSEKTKAKLSLLFSGKLNPFWSKKHTNETIEKMRESKLGSLNPMYNKSKSKEFIEHMLKDRTGGNN